MEFSKYNSIENAFQDDFIQSITEQGFADQQYVVQEKVHGANLSFLTDGRQVLSAKRTAILSDKEQFYNSQQVQQKYQQKLTGLHRQLFNQLGIKTITVFGEIFGGRYPHPGVPADDSAKLIQSGIYYCPGNDFYAFDILVDNKTYLDTELASTLFEQHGFIYARSLFQGTLKECLAYPNAFKTTIPQQFRLPEIEGNICEGTVIRPVHPQFLRTGARVLIKHKNEQWSENNKYIDRKLLGRLLEEEALSEEANFLCEELYKLITKNRLFNVISKTGEVDPVKNHGRVLGMFNKDVLYDFLKMYRDKYTSLEKHEAKSVNKFLNKQAGKLIEDFFDA